MRVRSSVLMASVALVACGDSKRSGFVRDDPAAPPPSSPRDAGIGPRDAAPEEVIEGSSSSGTSAVGEVGGTVRDSGAPSFTEVYLAVIRQRCSPCHTGSGEAATGITLGKLDMSTQAKAHANLVNVIAQGSECTTPWNYVRVSPGSLDKSILYEKIAPGVQTCGAKMPLDRAPLSRAELVLIADWILAGAHDD